MHQLVKINILQFILLLMRYMSSIMHLQSATYEKPEGDKSE